VALAGEYGPLSLDAPVGRPSMVILDHLVLVRGIGRGVLAGSPKALVSMLRPQ